jgi:hypothetical protein
VGIEEAPCWRSGNARTFRNDQLVVSMHSKDLKVTIGYNYSVCDLICCVDVMKCPDITRRSPEVVHRVNQMIF